MDDRKKEGKRCPTPTIFDASLSRSQVLYNWTQASPYSPSNDPNAFLHFPSFPFTLIFTIRMVPVPVHLYVYDICAKTSAIFVFPPPIPKK